MTGVAYVCQVAREAGVSYATASRALNGSARTVRAENLTRVRAAAAKLGLDKSADELAALRAAKWEDIIAAAGDRDVEFPANVVVDGSPNGSTVLTLSHWPGLAAPPGVEAVRSIDGNIELVECNRAKHFDCICRKIICEVLRQGGRTSELAVEIA